MRRCPVWAAIRSTPTPAMAALVTCPARSECPLIRALGRPAASARVLRIRTTVPPVIGARAAAAAQAGEQRAGRGAADGEPGCDGADGIGVGVLAVGEADDLATPVWVGLGPAHTQQQPGSLGLEVGEGESRQLGAPHGGGEAEQDERGIPGPARRASVDAPHDSTDVGDDQRPGLPARRHPEPPAQPSTDLPHRVVQHRVGCLVPAVFMRDGGAGHLDSGERSALLGSFGQVGAHGARTGRQRLGIARPAHHAVHCRHAWA
jgi:hypothetical protein